MHNSKNVILRNKKDFMQSNMCTQSRVTRKANGKVDSVKTFRTCSTCILKGVVLGSHY